MVFNQRSPAKSRGDPIGKGSLCTVTEKAIVSFLVVKGNLWPDVYDERILSKDICEYVNTGKPKHYLWQCSLHVCPDTERSLNVHGDFYHWHLSFVCLLFSPFSSTQLILDTTPSNGRHAWYIFMLPLWKWINCTSYKCFLKIWKYNSPIFSPELMFSYTGFLKRVVPSEYTFQLRIETLITLKNCLSLNVFLILLAGFWANRLTSCDCLPFY